MINRSMLRKVAKALGYCLVLIFAGIADAADHPLPIDQIQKYVAEYLGETAGKSTVTLAYANLSGDAAPQALLYISGPDWCGSGGCTMVVLRESKGVLEAVAETTITRLPIAVLSSRSHGWLDLAVWIAGGGGPSRQSLMQFDGRRYPSNPSMAPPVIAQDDDLFAGELLIWKEAEAGPLKAAAIYAAEREYQKRQMQLEAEGNCDASQTSLNICSFHRFQEADARLNVLYDWLHTGIDATETGKRLQPSQRAWLRFIEADCLYQVGPREGRNVSMTLQHPGSLIY